MRWLLNLKVKLGFQNHPYHLVTPSPWPILTSFSVFFMCIGAVMCFHGYPYGSVVFYFGFSLTFMVMFLWFKDIVIEATYMGDHTIEVKKGIILGVILFIVSEVMAFLSIFWAFFHSSLSPAIEIGASWPPFGIEALDPFAIPLLNTILLLSSGALVTLGHHALIQGNRNSAIQGTFLCVIFALIFTALQVFEYEQAGFTLSDSVFGSTFFCSTGLHGLHVVVGTLFLLVGLWRTGVYHMTESHHQGFESAIVYWHFVDVVWIFLYLCIYYWSFY